VKNFAMLMIVGCIVALAGCKSESSGGGSGGSEKKEAAAVAAPAAGGGDIGVKECDDYIAKYSKCLEKMPAEARTASEAAFKQAKDGWKAAAATPEGKASLATACKAMADASAAACP